MLDDRALVQAFQSGDAEAYDAMYARYVERVRRTCSRILRDPHDAEEATQETFIRAYRALGRFNGRYQLGAWLARIASNVSIDHVRSSSRTPHLVALPADDPIEASAKDPGELIAGGIERVDETMSDIQPLHAEALKLRAVDGLSHKEMAGRLEMTPDQVKALLHRARLSFRRAWQNAQGWALAPVLLLRRSASRSESVSGAGVAQAPGLSGLAPQLIPMVEKVAASAMIVAVALSGPGGTAPATSPYPGPSSPEKAVAAPAEPSRAASGLVVAQVASGAPHSGPRAEGELQGLSDVLKRVPELVEAPKGHDAPKQRPSEPKPEDDGDQDVGAEAGKTRKTVTRTIKKAVHDLAPPPSI